DFNNEIEIMTQLRISLSGMACPTYVVDTPEGAGKIPVPLKFWDSSTEMFRDYTGKTIYTERWQGPNSVHSVCGINESQNVINVR
ncbi:MAG: hypothetical protein ABIH42_08900, partial [Planctomycetota bacterium]